MNLEVSMMKAEGVGFVGSSDPLYCGTGGLRICEMCEATGRLEVWHSDHALVIAEGRYGRSLLLLGGMLTSTGRLRPTRTNDIFWMQM